MRLIIIDRRRLMADALGALLAGSGRFTVSACTVDEASQRLAAMAESHLILLVIGDSREPEVELVQLLRQVAPDVRIALIADRPDPELIRCVLAQEAAALVLSTVTADDLEVTLDHVLRGNTALPAGWRGTLEQAENDPVFSLSARQREVLELLAAGYSYEGIGERLIISANTVKFHVHSTYVRLGVTNRMAAVNLLNEHVVGHGRHSPDAHPNVWVAPTQANPH